MALADWAATHAANAGARRATALAVVLYGASFSPVIAEHARVQLSTLAISSTAPFFTDALDESVADLVAGSHAELEVIADNDRLMPETVQRLKDELDAIRPTPVAA